MTKRIVAVYWVKINQRQQKHKNEKLIEEKDQHPTQKKPNSAVRKLKTLFTKFNRGV